MTKLRPLATLDNCPGMFKENNVRICDKYYNHTCWLKYSLKVHLFNNKMAALLKKSHLMIALIVIRRLCLDAAADAEVSPELSLACTHINGCR